MRAARLAILSFALVCALSTLVAPAAPAGPGAPTGLGAFLLRPGESDTHTFSRTPAFAWKPVRGASCYEFQLATSRAFDGNSIVWSNVVSGRTSGSSCRSARAIRIPATSINLTLPWFTGRPYALYAHVRAITPAGPSRWSKAYGFNMRWENLPIPMASRPGLLRWTPVEGATSYQVWYTDLRRSFATHTNVADLREFYTFHDDPNWWAIVRWRVRAVRHVLGTVPNGLPAVSYGPWSPEYTTRNPDLSGGTLQTKVAVSDVITSSWKSGAHRLMPGVTWTGAGLNGSPYSLFRAYAFTDRDCVNVVFVGSAVGGPAFAPRLSGTHKLPTSLDELDSATLGILPPAESEGDKVFMADGTPLVANETIDSETGARPRIDLPDVDSKTTRYFWTVVPVGVDIDQESGALVYYDAESPQDACQAGRVSTFAKRSEPAVTVSGTPYVSGLTPKGRLLASAGSRPTVYSAPLVAWRPVIGATAYEIQWSRTRYPWRMAGRRLTLATSAVLNVKPGVWYYRVRGLNAAQVGTPVMTWSRPVAVRVMPPTFRISGG